jgi:hypothetical protein
MTARMIHPITETASTADTPSPYWRVSKNPGPPSPRRVALLAEVTV